MINPDAIRIDTYGIKITKSVIDVIHDGQPFQFVLDSELKRATTFHGALFTNHEIDSPSIKHYPPENRFAYFAETPVNVSFRKFEQVSNDFRTAFTHQQHLVETGAPYKDMLFGSNWLNVWNAAEADILLGDCVTKSKLVSFMGSIQHANTGAYTFRREVAEYCIAQDCIDSFGKGIREVESKRVALEPYCFSSAMENHASDFYFTEKLIYCMLLHTIPIYFGCPSIGE